MGKSYFSVSEFTNSDTARKLKIDNTPNVETLRNINELISFLNPIRDSYGFPIYITSGYRCEALNRAVKGAKNSAHLFGFACDMQVRGNLRTFANEFRMYLESNNLRYDELIFERNGSTEWLHFAWKGKDNKQRMKCFDLIK